MTFRKLAVGAVIGCAVILSANANAYVSFYFAEKGTTTQITNKTIGGIGSTFDVTLCLQIVGDTFPLTSVETFVGYDRADSYSSGVTPLDGKIGLNGTPEVALTNPNSHFPTLFLFTGPGATRGSEVIRPYGLDVSQALQGGGSPYSTNGQAIQLFDLSLKNTGLSSGSYTLVIWDAGDSLQDTSWVGSGAANLRPGEHAGTLTVNVGAVPEPASMIAIGLGASALLMRRRKK